MSWHDVLDQKLDLYNFWRGPYGSLSGDEYNSGISKIAFKFEGRIEESPENSGKGELLAAQECIKLHRADPIYVDSKMMTLLEAAAENFQPEPLQEFDFITLFGFVVLPRCFVFKDVHDKDITVRAFAWMPAHIYKGEYENIVAQGISISLYSHFQDLLDGRDGYSSEFTQKELLDLRTKFGTPFTLAHTTPWEFGMEFPKDMAEYAAWWKYIQTFLRLTQQTIGDRYRQQAPRASLRRWQRQMKHPHHEPYITVIRLRRPKGQSSESESSVEWSHQWIVGGHWRNQPYPSLGQGVTRQIWIGEHIKGPEDKPLLVRKGRVFELVR